MSEFSRRDFLKLGGAAALVPVVGLLEPSSGEPGDFETRLSAAQENIDTFLTVARRIPPTATPIHPNGNTDPDMQAAFYPPLLDQRVIQAAWGAFSLETFRRSRGSKDSTSLANVAQEAGDEVLKRLVETDSYLDMLSNIERYFPVLDAIKRWQSSLPQPLESPEPEEFSNQELNDLAEFLTSIFPVPAVVGEWARPGDENAWGEAGQSAIRIATEKLSQLNEKDRAKMFILIFGHELSHLFDVWMSANKGFIFRYLPKTSSLYELFRLRSLADGMRTLALDGHTQLRLSLEGYGVREHPWEFLNPDTTPEEVWNSLLLLPTAVHKTRTIGFMETELDKYSFIPDENRLDHYLYGVISNLYPDGLTLDQIRSTDWLTVAGLELAGAALGRIKSFNLDDQMLQALFGEISPVPPEKLAETLAPTAVQLLTTGEYTGSIPAAVLKRFYWGSLGGSGELLAHVGSLWFYWKSGLADDRENKLLSDILRANPQVRYLRKMTEVLDRESLAKLVGNTRTRLGKVFPAHTSFLHEISLGHELLV